MTARYSKIVSELGMVLVACCTWATRVVWLCRRRVLWARGSISRNHESQKVARSELKLFTRTTF